MITCNFLHSNGPKYAAGTPVRAIVVGRFEWRWITTENSIQETTGFPGLGDGLTGRKSLSMFPKECRLSDIEQSLADSE